MRDQRTYFKAFYIAERKSKKDSNKKLWIHRWPGGTLINTQFELLKWDSYQEAFITKFEVTTEVFVGWLEAGMRLIDLGLQLGHDLREAGIAESLNLFSLFFFIVTGCRKSNPTPHQVPNVQNAQNSSLHLVFLDRNMTPSKRTLEIWTSDCIFIWMPSKCINYLIYE